MFANSTAVFPDRIRDGMVDLHRTTRPALELFARYAPEITCLIPGLINAGRSAGAAFRRGVFHAEIRVGDQYPGYTADDRPAFGDTGKGPNCVGLPNPPAPIPAPNSDDGATTRPPILDLPENDE